MRLEPIKFAGFNAGETAFDAVEGRGPANDRLRLQQLLDRLAEGVLHPGSSTFTSVIIAGHSDRQDLSTMSCDERRKSEGDAARARALAAWEWTKVQVNGRLVLQGRAVGDEWWETSPSMTWGLVFASAGQLDVEHPSSEAERQANRRVLFLVSPFPRV